MLAASTRAERLDHLRGTLRGIVTRTDTNSKNRDAANQIVDNILEMLSVSDWQEWRFGYIIGHTKNAEVRELLCMLIQHPLRAFFRMFYRDEIARLESTLSKHCIVKETRIDRITNWIEAVRSM